MKLFKEVRPGDLITADQINQVMLEIEKLAERVDQLEAGGPPDQKPVAITAVLGLRREGELLEVQGKNFEVPPELNVVTIDGGAPIQHFGAGSNETRLFFIVPAGNQGLPKQVTLRVATRTSAASFPFLLEAPQEIAKGSLTMVLSKLLPQHGVIGNGTSYELTFDVTGITTMADTYDVAGTLSAAGWGLQVAGSGAGTTTIQIPRADPPGATRSVVVRVAVPAGAPDQASATLSLSVVSRSNPQLRQDKALVLTVGDAPPQAGTDVVVAFAGTVSEPGSAAGGVLLIPGTRTNVLVNYTVKIKEAGEYKFFGTLENGTGWTMTPTSAVPKAFNAAAGSDIPLTVRVNATETASTPTLLIARAERADGGKAGEDRREIRRT